MFPLKIDLTKRDHNRILIFSDMHYGHNRPFIYEKRGYASIEEHDRDLLDRLVRKSHPEGLLISLGDLVFGNGAAGKLKGILERVAFREAWLMPGNHFSGWLQLAKQGFDMQEQGKKIHWIPDFIRLSLKKVSIVCSHEPLVSWRGIGHGAVHLNGHCHGNLAETRLSTGTRKSLDVGPDSMGDLWPASLAEILKLMEGRENYADDHHAPKQKDA